VFFIVPGLINGPLFGSTSYFANGNGLLTLSPAGVVSTPDASGKAMPNSGPILDEQAYVRIVGVNYRFTPTTNATNNGGSVTYMQFSFGSETGIAPAWPTSSGSTAPVRSMDDLKNCMQWVGSPVDDRWVDFFQNRTNARTYTTDSIMEPASRWLCTALFFEGLGGASAIGNLEIAIHVEAHSDVGQFASYYAAANRRLNRHFVDHHGPVLSLLSRTPHFGTVDDVSAFLERAHKAGLVEAAKFEATEYARSMGRLGKAVGNVVRDVVPRVAAKKALAGNNAEFGGSKGRATSSKELLSAMQKMSMRNVKNRSRKQAAKRRK